MRVESQMVTNVTECLDKHRIRAHQNLSISPRRERNWPTSVFMINFDMLQAKISVKVGMYYSIIEIKKIIIR